jgi:WXG100 family type VII secretion target
MALFTFIADQIVEQINAYKGQGQQVENVISNVQKAFNPLQQSWKGKGSGAYAQEITQKLIPTLGELVSAIAGFGGNLGKALNIMNAADGMVRGIIGQVAGFFSKIF